mmetsp:Transcript_17798/g.62418  ORF Transcript_17798/g.62418 Transcript_17798/m.62418 type:complete len:251 (+) Transcript_17798:2263-3015(+)
MGPRGRRPRQRLQLERQVAGRSLQGRASARRADAAYDCGGWPGRGRLGGVARQRLAIGTHHHQGRAPDEAVVADVAAIAERHPVLPLRACVPDRHRPERLAAVVHSSGAGQQRALRKAPRLQRHARRGPSGHDGSHQLREGLRCPHPGYLIGHSHRDEDRGLAHGLGASGAAQIRRREWPVPRLHRRGGAYRRGLQRGGGPAAPPGLADLALRRRGLPQRRGRECGAAARRPGAATGRVWLGSCAALHLL